MISIWPSAVFNLSVEPLCSSSKIGPFPLTIQGIRGNALEIMQDVSYECLFKEPLRNFEREWLGVVSLKFNKPTLVLISRFFIRNWKEGRDF